MTDSFKEEYFAGERAVSESEAKAVLKTFGRNNSQIDGEIKQCQMFKLDLQKEALVITLQTYSG